MDHEFDVELQSLVPASENVGRDFDLAIESRDEKTQSTLKEQSPPWLRRIGAPWLLVTIPLAYVALICIVGFLDTKTESAFGNNVLEVLQVASTIWPISFAAVLGPFFKTLALYCAEQGSTLGTLELLLTSHTTASAIMNFVLFGSSHAWPAVVIAAWCISPLGGQAAVRSIRLERNSTSTEATARYYLGNNSIRDTELRSSPDDFVLDLRRNIYTILSGLDVRVSHANGSSFGFNKAVAALGGQWSASRVGQRDFWQNIRIPFAELLPQYDRNEPTTWVPVPTDIVVPYASFIGIPINRVLLEAGNSTMVVQTYYETMSCREPFDGSSWLKPTANKLHFHRNMSAAFDYGKPYNNSNGTVNPNIPATMFLDFVNDAAPMQHFSRELDLNKPEPSVKLTLVIGEFCDDEYSLRTCDLSISYVDVEVTCTRLTEVDDPNCRASRIRHTLRSPLDSNLTMLSQNSTAYLTVHEFPFAAESNSRGNLIHNYLLNPPTINEFSAGCLSDVRTDVFEARFSTALNTFIMATYNKYSYSRLNSESIDLDKSEWRKTNATWDIFTDRVYHLHLEWYYIWHTSIWILFIIAVANAIIRAVIKAPDFLDGMVGLTRDSEFIKVPQGRTGENGLDRLQRLQATKVMICDTRPEADVGRIALTTDLGRKGLSWERAYE